MPLRLGTPAIKRLASNRACWRSAPPADAEIGPGRRWRAARTPARGAHAPDPRRGRRRLGLRGSPPARPAPALQVLDAGRPLDLLIHPDQAAPLRSRQAVVCFPFREQVL